ncbi:MAG: hypothetical protein WKG00_06175 [Polyangiaceae bacterium]
MDKRWMGWMVSVGALSCAAGCGAGDDVEGVGEVDGAEVGEAEQAIFANPGVCQNGMSTSLKKLHAPSDFGPNGEIPAYFSCTLAEVPDYVNYVCATDEKVCKFLQDVVDGHGRLQCLKWIENGKKRTCVDVVDKDPAGNLLEGKPQTQYQLNFNIALVDDNAASPEVGYWATQLPLYPDAPISLSVAGFYYNLPTTPNLAYDRNYPPTWAVRRVIAFKFDPQDCGGCVNYAGPNYDRLTNIGKTQLSVWYPEFDPTNCRFDREQGASGAWEYLTPTRCNLEATYRATGR